MHHSAFLFSIDMYFLHYPNQKKKKNERHEYSECLVCVVQYQSMNEANNPG